MTVLKIFYKNGETITTRVNATFEEVFRYIVEKKSDIRISEEDIQRCTKIELVNLQEETKHKNSTKVELTCAEKYELSCVRLNGFRYLVRNEIGTVEAFVNKPSRHRKRYYFQLIKKKKKYSFWIESKFPISEEKQRRIILEFGQYNFLSWEDEPVLIDDLLDYEYDD